MSVAAPKGGTNPPKGAIHNVEHHPHFQESRSGAKGASHRRTGSHHAGTRVRGVQRRHPRPRHPRPARNHRSGRRIRWPPQVAGCERGRACKRARACRQRARRTRVRAPCGLAEATPHRIAESRDCRRTRLLPRGPNTVTAAPRRKHHDATTVTSLASARRTHTRVRRTDRGRLTPDRSGRGNRARERPTALRAGEAGSAASAHGRTEGTPPLTRRGDAARTRPARGTVRSHLRRPALAARQPKRRARTRKPLPNDARPARSRPCRSRRRQTRSSSSGR